MAASVVLKHFTMLYGNLTALYFWYLGKPYCVVLCGWTLFLLHYLCQLYFILNWYSYFTVKKKHWFRQQNIKIMHLQLQYCTTSSHPTCCHCYPGATANLEIDSTHSSSKQPSMFPTAKCSQRAAPLIPWKDRSSDKTSLRATRSRWHHSPHRRPHRENSQLHSITGTSVCYRISVVCFNVELLWITVHFWFKFLLYYYSQQGNICSSFLKACFTKMFFSPIKSLLHNVDWKCTEAMCGWRMATKQEELLLDSHWG